MPKIDAWQCPHTQQVFLDKGEYQSHLRCLGRARARQRRRDAFQAKCDAYIADTLWKATTFADIEAWYLDPDNHRFLAERMRFLNPYKFKKLNPNSFRIVSLGFTGMRWYDKCSNAHAAPRGERTNWNAYPELPRSFPGWMGSLSYEVANGPGVWKDIFHGTGINITSGGRGLLFEVTLFAQDWASMDIWRKISA